jgi:rare lipoprotein A
LNTRLPRTLACAALALTALTTTARAQTSAPAVPGAVIAPVLAPLTPVSTASAGDVTVTALPSATLAKVARFRGAGSSADAGRAVKIQQQNAAATRWSTIATARVAGDGSFVARWTPQHIGRFTLRAVVGTSTAPLSVTVYKPALATWYGPGFFGKTTACGVPLTPDLEGLAHRTLPCGTQVAVNYGGRSLVLPVIDRGPYGGNGAQWDVTQAAAEALGMTTTVTLGAVSLPQLPLSTVAPTMTPATPVPVATPVATPAS